MSKSIRCHPEFAQTHCQRLVSKLLESPFKRKHTERTCPKALVWINALLETSKE